MKYTAQLNQDVDGEWIIYLNKQVFCHLSDGDFEIFLNNFKANVELNNERQQND